MSNVQGRKKIEDICMHTGYTDEYNQVGEVHDCTIVQVSVVLRRTVYGDID